MFNFARLWLIVLTLSDSEDGDLAEASPKPKKKKCAQKFRQDWTIQSSLIVHSNRGHFIHTVQFATRTW